MDHKNRGFTLIELLVVAAIIALLIAISVPTLTKAREQARAADCASNMHQIGTLINTFASLHQDRGPGAGFLGSSEPFPAYLSWADVLNFCLIEENPDPLNGSPALYGIWQVQSAAAYAGYIAGKHLLVCPSFAPLSDYERVYAITYDADGGGGYTLPGPYGLAADPRTACSNPNLFATNGTGAADDGYGYALGANLKRFGPNQFLLVETQYEDFFPRYGDATIGTLKGGKVVLGNVYPFCADGNQLAFRHPYAQSANFLFFDAHVEQLTPNDNVDSAMRLRIDQ